MEKKNYLFIYENKWNTPNGDPFTGEQRYDEVSGKALVSDCRLKRFVRDKFIELLDEESVFYEYDEIRMKQFVSKMKDKLSGAAARYTKFLSENPDFEKMETIDVMKKFIDVRLFGGVMTETGNNVGIEGPVQFPTFTPSMNRVTLETIQNTTVFPSDAKNSQGSIGTSSIVPYSIFAVDGWLNEITAESNNLTNRDLDTMLGCLWLGIRDKNTRSKTGSEPVILFQVEYNPIEPVLWKSKKPNYRTIGKLSSLVKIESEIDDENFRSFQDFELNFDDLIEACSNDDVKCVYFYTERKDLKAKFDENNKFIFKEIY